MDDWNSLEALDAEISVADFLFTAKCRPVLHHVRTRVDTRRPHFTLFDYPRAGQIAELLGAGEVRITDGDGRIVARGENPCSAFRGIRRQFFWDDLDFLYFAGYATWNYLTAPFLLMREGFVVRKREAVPGETAFYARLQVTYPDDIPAHSREQIFYFDERRLLCRLDYTAEVVGEWAHAGSADPIRPRPLPGPTLVALEVHRIEPVPAVLINSIQIIADLFHYSGGRSGFG